MKTCDRCNKVHDEKFFSCPFCAEQQVVRAGKKAASAATALARWVLFLFIGLLTLALLSTGHNRLTVVLLAVLAAFLFPPLYDRIRLAPYWKLALFPALFFGAVFSDTAPSTLKTAKARPNPNVAAFALTAINLKSKLVVAGRTNLPIGTTLFVSVENESGKQISQDNAAVGADGQFVGPPVGLNGKGLPPGAYVIDVSSMTSYAEPESIQDAIGKDWVNFTGDLKIDRPVGHVITARWQIKWPLSAHPLQIVRPLGQKLDQPDTTWALEEVKSLTGNTVISEVAKNIPAAPNSQWEYSQETDQMRGTVTKFALLKAEETLNFAFPYAGGSAVTLQLRTRPSEGLTVMLLVSKGQFYCNEDGGQLAVKFDNEPPQSYGCTESSDASTNVLFIDGARRLLQRLRKSEKVMIEAPFYQEGRQQMTFNTAGLVWDH